MLLHVRGCRLGAVELQRPDYGQLMGRMSRQDWSTLMDCQRRLAGAVTHFLTLRASYRQLVQMTGAQMQPQQVQQAERCERACQHVMRHMRAIQTEQAGLLARVREQLAAEAALELPAVPPPPDPPAPPAPEVRLVLEPPAEPPAAGSREPVRRSARMQLIVRRRRDGDRGSGRCRPPTGAEAPVPDPGPEPARADDFSLNIPRHADPARHAKNCHMAALGLITTEHAMVLRSRLRVKPRRQAFDKTMQGFVFSSWRKRRMPAPADGGVSAAKRRRLVGGGGGRGRRCRSSRGRWRAASPPTTATSRSCSPAANSESGSGSPAASPPPPPLQRQPTAAQMLDTAGTERVTADAADEVGEAPHLTAERPASPPVTTSGAASPPVTAPGAAPPPVMAPGAAPPPVTTSAAASPPVTASGAAPPPVTVPDAQRASEDSEARAANLLQMCVPCEMNEDSAPSMPSVSALDGVDRQSESLRGSRPTAALSAAADAANIRSATGTGADVAIAPQSGRRSGSNFDTVTSVPALLQDSTASGSLMSPQIPVSNTMAVPMCSESTALSMESTGHSLFLSDTDATPIARTATCTASASSAVLPVSYSSASVPSAFPYTSTSPEPSVTVVTACTRADLGTTTVIRPTSPSTEPSVAVVSATDPVTSPILKTSPSAEPLIAEVSASDPSSSPNRPTSPSTEPSVAVVSATDSVTTRAAVSDCGAGISAPLPLPRAPTSTEAGRPRVSSGAPSTVATRIPCISTHSDPSTAGPRAAVSAAASATAAADQTIPPIFVSDCCTSVAVPLPSTTTVMEPVVHPTAAATHSGPSLNAVAAAVPSAVSTENSTSCVQSAASSAPILSSQTRVLSAARGNRTDGGESAEPPTSRGGPRSTFIPDALD